MKKFIATTSIAAEPGKTAYDWFVNEHTDWTLIISGDEQTDDVKFRKFVEHKNAVYLSLEDQNKMCPWLSSGLGLHTDTRRMFSVLYAYNTGADIIALVDDDNFPLQSWGKDLLVGVDCVVTLAEQTSGIVLDPLHVMQPNSLVWHRGFPVDCLEDRDKYNLHTNVRMTPLVQANMWEGEPDTDAMCRLLTDTDRFLRRKIYPTFTTNAFAPWNTQNTVIDRKIVKDFFLFPSLGRMSDIWIAYHIEAQYLHTPIVVYGPPTVVQNRNAHNILIDFKREVRGYTETTTLLLNYLNDPSALQRFVPLEEWNLFQRWQKELII